MRIDLGGLTFKCKIPRHPLIKYPERPRSEIKPETEILDQGSVHLDHRWRSRSDSKRTPRAISAIRVGNVRGPAQSPSVACASASRTKIQFPAIWTVANGRWRTYFSSGHVLSLAGTPLPRITRRNERRSRGDRENAKKNHGRPVAGCYLL